jgi:hypothetical protein
MAQGTQWPTRRTSGLVVKTVRDEVLVYDLDRHRAHSLNPVAAAVWRSCDGARDLPALAAAARAELGAPVPRRRFASPSRRWGGPAWSRGPSRRPA